MINKVVTIQADQTVFDVALQTEGTVENIVEFMSRNGIESLDSDVTGVEVTYEVKGNAVQNYYIRNEVTIANKPKRYLNTVEPSLIQDNGFFLFQQDGYKILL